jgi:hypothetical protein
MSDNLGPNQTRVLDSENRSFESVIYQKRKPPLSSEVNLEGKIDTERTQLVMKNIFASGMFSVGEIKDNADASLYETGTVLCDSSFSQNTFKLVSFDKGQDTQTNIAWVNGWRLLIQGTNSPDDNNIIILPVPPTTGTRVDFVFLEVWRKLVYPSDVVFKYGNFLYGGINYSNDLIDPAMGIETSLRIQVQYRIRVASTDIETYPEGFDPTTVFVQGPLLNPISTCTNAYFSSVPGDPGLWRAGPGDPTDPTLGTVDDYTYAIPLFAVRRRNTGAYEPNLRSNGSARTLANYIAGYASDRPDNLFNNWVVAEDILDMRHKVVTQENVKELCGDAFEKLVNNRLPGKMTKRTLGEDSFGISLVQPDAVSDVDLAGSTRIAQGDGVRRVFSNAQIDQPESFVIKTVADKSPSPGSNWTLGDSVAISLAGYPTGSQITAVSQVYTKHDSSAYVLNSLSEYTKTALPASSVTISLGTSPTLSGTTYPMIIEYIIRYPSGPNGLTEVPELFLECQKEGSLSSIAMQDMDIRVRDAGPIVTSDGTKYAMLTNRGGSSTNLFDFGHQMVYHVIGNGTQVFTVLRTINGYEILGFASIKVGGILRSPTSIDRDTTKYTVDLGFTITSGVDIEVTLYTGNKFFEGNKQGRAITDCWEMMEIVPDETAGGGRIEFHIDSGTKAIVALASYEGENGFGYAYKAGIHTKLNTSNIEYPYDSTKTYGTIKFALADVPAAGEPIEVPVLVRSAITDTEGYTFFYKTLPYQGLLDSSATGVIEATGPAITTTSGSGTITDFYYSAGQAKFNDSTVVNGLNTQWSSNAKAGQFIRSDSDTSREYVIQEVYNNTTIYLDVIPDSTTVSFGSYRIFEKDQPAFLQRNIIDLLPTYSSTNDSSGKNEFISTAVSDGYPVLETRIISRVQDIEALPKDTVWVGMDTADRGRSGVNILSTEDLAPLGLGNLGLKFEKLDATTAYHKTYQSYIINKEDSGRLYLLVVGSETDNTSTGSCFFNHASDMDSVDIFELPGRPLLMRRIA